MNLNIYTDGSSMNLSNKNVGGWSFIITKDNKVLVEKYGKLRSGKQDMNRAELEALYQAIKYVEKSYPKNKFTIYTDCETLRDCVLGKAQRKANRDIWEQVEPIFERKVGYFNIKPVRSHQANSDDIHEQFNNRADKLAKVGVNSLLVMPVDKGVIYDGKHI